MKRPALKNERVVVLGMTFWARKVSSLLRNARLVQGLFLGSAHVSERAASVYDEGTICDTHGRYKTLKQWINLWSTGFENISVNIKSRRQFAQTPANT